MDQAVATGVGSLHQDARSQFAFSFPIPSKRLDDVKVGERRPTLERCLLRARASHLRSAALKIDSTVRVGRRACRRLRRIKHGGSCARSGLIVKARRCSKSAFERDPVHGRFSPSWITPGEFVGEAAVEPGDRSVHPSNSSRGEETGDVQPNSFSQDHMSILTVIASDPVTHGCSRERFPDALSANLVSLQGRNFMSTANGSNASARSSEPLPERWRPADWMTGRCRAAWQRSLRRRMRARG